MLEPCPRSFPSYCFKEKLIWSEKSTRHGALSSKESGAQGRKRKGERRRAPKGDAWLAYPVVALLTSGGGEVKGVWEEDWPNPESSEASVHSRKREREKMRIISCHVKTTETKPYVPVIDTKKNVKLLTSVPGGVRGVSIRIKTRIHSRSERSLVTVVLRFLKIPTPSNFNHRVGIYERFIGDAGACNNQYGLNEASPSRLTALTCL